MEQEPKPQTPIPTIMPIRIDMTVGDESARIVKIKHQGVEETVRVLNKVLKKMNADVKITIVKRLLSDEEKSDADETAELGRYGIVADTREETLRGLTANDS